MEGSIEFIVGGESRTGGPEFWALAQSGVSHTFGNAGNTPARLVIIHAPAADAYFAELEALWKDSTPTPETERELMSDTGWNLLTIDYGSNLALRQWLGDAGFTDIERASSLLPDEHGVMIARKR